MVVGVDVIVLVLVVVVGAMTVVAGSRPEMVVGWYHSHPGFGCWLSNVDVNTQQVRCFSVALEFRSMR